MEKDFQELDPRGDVVLVLKYHCEPVPSEERLKETTTEVSEFKEKSVVEAQDEPAQPYHGASQREFRARVSSRHLSLKSLYFNKMFSGEWSEGATLSAHGSVEIQLQNNEDPIALLTLLNIIHGHTRKVQRSVDLKLLTNLAILVDYYDCLEVVEIHSDMWIENLKQTLPTNFSEDLIRWLCISWVFRKPEMFKSITGIVQRHSEGPIDTYELPIPVSIVDEIERSRLAAISSGMLVVKNIIEKYENESPLCQCYHNSNLLCDGMVLGVLIKRSQKIGMWPLSDVPPVNMSFFHLKTQICELDIIPTLCTLISRGSRSCDYGSRDYWLCSEDYLEEPCNITIQKSLSDIEANLCGLDLSAFKPKN